MSAFLKQGNKQNKKIKKTRILAYCLNCEEGDVKKGSLLFFFFFFQIIVKNMQYHVYLYKAGSKQQKNRGWNIIWCIGEEVQMREEAGWGCRKRGNK